MTEKEIRKISESLKGRYARYDKICNFCEKLEEHRFSLIRKIGRELKWVASRKKADIYNQTIRLIWMYRT